jgi:hypothetical protein
VADIAGGLRKHVKEGADGIVAAASEITRNLGAI